MSYAHNNLASQETKYPPLPTHPAPKVPDMPLQDLPPAHLRERNDFPTLEQDYSPPDRTPEALDERLYDDLCRGVLVPLPQPFILTYTKLYQL
jgi:hypothetical protein